MRCPVCGGATSCPGDPPKGARPIDTEQEYKAFPKGQVPDGWTITHWKMRIVYAVRALPGWEISLCGRMQMSRGNLHGWPQHQWVGQCTYACAVPKASMEHGSR